MKPRIEKVVALEKYKLQVQFDDGTSGTLDVSHLAGKGVLMNWDADDSFYKVYISNESGAITWPNEIDIDTYNAYCKIKSIHPADYFQVKQKYAPHL